MKDVISESTRGLILTMILHAERFYGLRIRGGLEGLLCIKNVTKMTSEKAEGKFLQAWNSINWKSRDSIRPFIPFFERAYRRTPRDIHSSHSQIDKQLVLEGFEVRQNRLLEINHKKDFGTRFHYSSEHIEHLRGNLGDTHVDLKCKSKCGI